MLPPSDRCRPRCRIIPSCLFVEFDHQFGLGFPMNPSLLFALDVGAHVDWETHSNQSGV